MSESIEDIESKDIREQLNKALEENDIRTISYIANEYLTDKLNRAPDFQ